MEIISDTNLVSTFVPSTDFLISGVVNFEIGFLELCASWTSTPAILWVTLNGTPSCTNFSAISNAIKLLD